MTEEEINKLQESIRNQKDNLKNLEDSLEKKVKYLSDRFENIYNKTFASEKEYLNVLKQLNTSYKRDLAQQEIKNKLFTEATKTERKKIDVIKNQIEASEKQIEEQKKNPGFWAKAGWTKDRDLLTSQYSSYQLSSGLSALFEGRFLSGITQMAKVIPQAANFMGGPFYGAMVALAGATIKAIDSLSALSVTSKRLAGGKDTTGKKITQSYHLNALAMAYNQKGSDLTNFITSELGTGAKQRLYEDDQFKNAYFSMRAGLEQIGVDPNKANSLASQQLTIGMSSSDMRRFNYELREVTKTMDILSGNKFISAYEELNKTLIANNINGMASAESLAKFQDALNRGTLSANDFTRSLTTRRSSETSTLAGVGAFMAERGLGGKELQEAYRSGDMIRVAGIMRRGGNQITRGIEQLETGFAGELASMLGTSDIRELLALQSSTSWGGLGPDLKKLEVQNILSSGGSTAIGLSKKLKEIEPEEETTIRNTEKELITESVKLKGAFQAVGEAAKMLALQLGSAIEQDMNRQKQQNQSVETKTNYSTNVVNASQLDTGH